MGKYLQTYTVCKDWNSQQRTVFSISILRDAKVNQKERKKKKKPLLLTEILPAAPSCGLRRKLPTKLKKPSTEIVGNSLPPKTRRQFLFSCGETKPLCHISCSGTPRTCAPQQEKPPQWEACAPTTKSSPYLLQPEKARGQHRRPGTAKKTQNL